MTDYLIRITSRLSILTVTSFRTSGCNSCPPISLLSTTTRTTTGRRHHETVGSFQVRDVQCRSGNVDPSRTRRKFRQIEFVNEELDKFQSEVFRSRQQIADFNYNFFINNLETVLAGPTTRKTAGDRSMSLKTFFRPTWNKYANYNYKLGKKLLRAGVEV